jgi:hypothetical protein
MPWLAPRDREHVRWKGDKVRCWKKMVSLYDTIPPHILNVSTRTEAVKVKHRQPNALFFCAAG